MASILVTVVVAASFNPDVTRWNWEYAALTAGLLVAAWFLVLGGWRVALIARGGSRKYGDRVYLGLRGLYGVGLLLYTAFRSMRT